MKETKIEHDSFGEGSTTDRILTVVVKNHSDKLQRINLFSLIHPLPKDVDVLLYESSYDFALKMLPSQPIYITGLKLIYDNIQNIFHGITISHRTINGTIESHCFHPFYYVQQNPKDILKIECCPFDLALRGGSEIHFFMEPNSNITCQILTNYYNFTYNDYLREIKAKTKSAYSRAMPFVIENPTNERQNVYLFDLFKKPDTAISIKTPVNKEDAASYKTVIEALKMGYVMNINALKVYCENLKQFYNPLFFKDDEIGLNFMNYVKYDEGLRIIDCYPFPDIGVDSTIKTMIEPKTKMFFLFYKKDDKN